MWKLAIAITLAVAVGVDGFQMVNYILCMSWQPYETTLSFPCKNQNGAKPGEVLNCTRNALTECGCSMIDLLVERQNDLRRKVASGKETRGLGGGQPPAANMERLNWNGMQAHYLLGLYMNCRETFDATCIDWASLNEQGFNTMVYHYTSLSTFDAWKNTIDTWYNEVDKFNSSNIPNYRESVGTGNYTRMNNADMNSLACASFAIRTNYPNKPWHRFQICKYEAIQKWTFRKILSNAVPNKPLYKIGKPCSRCPYEKLGNSHDKEFCFHHNLCSMTSYELAMGREDENNVELQTTVQLEPVD